MFALLYVTLEIKYGGTFTRHARPAAGGKLLRRLGGDRQAMLVIQGGSSPGAITRRER